MPLCRRTLRLAESAGVAECGSAQSSRNQLYSYPASTLPLDGCNRLTQHPRDSRRAWSPPWSAAGGARVSNHRCAPDSSGRARGAAGAAAPDAAAIRPDHWGGSRGSLTPLGMLSDPPHFCAGLQLVARPRGIAYDSARGAPAARAAARAARSVLELPMISRRRRAPPSAPRGVCTTFTIQLHLRSQCLEAYQVPTCTGPRSPILLRLVCGRTPVATLGMWADPGRALSVPPRAS